MELLYERSYYSSMHERSLCYSFTCIFFEQSQNENPLEKSFSFYWKTLTKEKQKTSEEVNTVLIISKNFKAWKQVV